MCSGWIVDNWEVSVEQGLKALDLFLTFLALGEDVPVIQNLLILLFVRHYQMHQPGLLRVNSRHFESIFEGPTGKQCSHAYRVAPKTWERSCFPTQAALGWGTQVSCGYLNFQCGFLWRLGAHGEGAAGFEQFCHCFFRGGFGVDAHEGFGAAGAE
jgi:hypothetical protein